MNKELIIEMAQKAGLIDWDWEISAYGNEIKEFARLVAEHEREQCAKVCNDIDAEYEGEDVLATWCADAIRARGNP